MLLSKGSGGIPDLGWESRPPRLGIAPFEDLSLEDQEIGRGELRVRRHRPSACARCRQPVPHAYRRDTLFRHLSLLSAKPARSRKKWVMERWWPKRMKEGERGGRGLAAEVGGALVRHHCLVGSSI